MEPIGPARSRSIVRQVTHSHGGGPARSECKCRGFLQFCFSKKSDHHAQLMHGWALVKAVNTDCDSSNCYSWEVRRVSHVHPVSHPSPGSGAGTNKQHGPTSKVGGTLAFRELRNLRETKGVGSKVLTN